MVKTATATRKSGRKPAIEPGAGYLIEVERRGAAPDLWALLHRCEGDERTQSINLLNNYYAKHWPDRKLRVRGALSGKVIAEYDPALHGT